MPTSRWLIAVLALVVFVAALALPAPTPNLRSGPDTTVPVAAPSVEHLDAALDVLALDDHGTAHAPRRWQQARVEVAVGGPAATARAAAEVDETLAWLAGVTGVAFVRTDVADAPLQVYLAPGVRPAARLHHRSATGTITRAAAQWDPTHRHADRWRWEELLHAAGPAGDYGPPGAVLSTDQTASRPSPFDAWVLAALYYPEAVPTDRKELSVALNEAAARTAWLRPAADPGP